MFTLLIPYSYFSLRCMRFWFAAYVSLRIKIPSYVICNWRTPEGDLRSVATSNRITDAETIDAKDSYC